MVRLAQQPLAKEKQQGVRDEEENQEEQCYTRARGMYFAKDTFASWI